MKSLLLSPHNDDSELFCAYTAIREKPLIVVITDSYIQPNRGDIGCDADTRWQESVEAAKILGCPIIRVGLRDDTLTEDDIRRACEKFAGFDKVYIPAEQGGNTQHDSISKIAKVVFGDSCIQYTTYTKTELWTKGDIEVIPTEEEKELKRKALMCYQSQINLTSTRPHFQAVMGGKSEWLL